MRVRSGRGQPPPQLPQGSSRASGAHEGPRLKRGPPKTPPDRTEPVHPTSRSGMKPRAEVRVLRGRNIVRLERQKSVNRLEGCGWLSVIAFEALVPGHPVSTHRRR